MPLTFGAPQSQNPALAAPVSGAVATQQMPVTNNSGNPWLGLLGAGLGVASQFSGPNGLAPGATQSNLPSWMQGQWQGAFGAQNAAANRTAGQAVAGLTPAQLQAMQNIQNSVGFGMGDLQQAQNNASGLAGGVGASQIQNFFNPYQQSAVNSTVATLQRSQAQQDANIASQANMANAWGGDRSAVAQGLNDQNYDMAISNAVANLNNSGYQNAVTSAMQNQAGQLAGNAQLQQAILNRINTQSGQNQQLLGVGNQQQQQNQNVANWPIESAQIMGQNLNNGVGGQQGTIQNPISGAIAGLQGGLQFGNSLSQLLYGNNGQNGSNGNGSGGGQNPSGIINQLRSLYGSSGSSLGGAAGAGSYGAGGSSIGYATDQFGVPTGFSGAGSGLQLGGYSSGAGTDLGSMFDTNQGLLGSDYGSLFSSAGGEAAGGDAAGAASVIPTGSGAGAGTMLMPSTLSALDPAMTGMVPASQLGGDLLGTSYAGADAAAGAGADAAAGAGADAAAGAGGDAAAAGGLGTAATIALPLAAFAGIYALGQAAPFNTSDAFANANQALTGGHQQLQAALAANGGQVPVYGSPQYYNYISALNQIQSEQLNLASMKNGDFSAFSGGAVRPHAPYHIQNS